MKTRDYVHHYRGYWSGGGCENRRLCKDYEWTEQTSETLIELAMIRLILRRQAREVRTLSNRLL